MPKDEAQPAVIGGPPPAHPFVGDTPEGFVFSTYAHRRVLGHLPLPSEDSTTAELLTERLADDGGLPRPLEQSEVADILADLETDGHASSKYGWRMTDAGLESINA